MYSLIFFSATCPVSAQPTITSQKAEFSSPVTSRASKALCVTDQALGGEVYSVLMHYKKTGQCWILQALDEQRRLAIVIYKEEVRGQGCPGDPSVVMNALLVAWSQVDRRVKSLYVPQIPECLVIWVIPLGVKQVRVGAAKGKYVRRCGEGGLHWWPASSKSFFNLTWLTVGRLFTTAGIREI